MLSNRIETIEFDTVIVGGGAIGISIGYRLSQHLQNILNLEEMNTFAEVTSSRNAEVIHSGIYYKPGSLKAKACVKGLQQLYSFMDKYGVDYKKLGKLIVASTHDEVEAIHDLIETGEQNGLYGLSILSAAETVALEPNIAAKARIFHVKQGYLIATIS